VPEDRVRLTGDTITADDGRLYNPGTEDDTGGSGGTDATLGDMNWYP
jgi:hypothetical protein